MKTLPLYAAVPPLDIERQTSMTITKECRRCELHERAHTVCLPGEGIPGGLLLVGEGPGQEEDRLGRPFIGQSGAYLRRTVAKFWQGPLAIDNATRCPPPRTGLDDKHVDACRPYIASTLTEKFQRVVALGSWAAYSLTGRSMPPLSTRRSYSFLTAAAIPYTPVFFVLHPAAALRNRFVRKAFEEDLEWAITADVSPTAWGGVVHLVTDEEDAFEAVCRLSEAEWSSFDVESAGKRWDPSFRLLSVSLTPKGSRDAWVWTAEALADKGAREALLGYLGNPSKKGGQHIQYDTAAIEAGFDRAVSGIAFDARLMRKLLEPEAAADLGVMAELVGMGGSFDEMEQAKEEAVGKVKRVLQAEKRAEKKGIPNPRSLTGEGLVPDYALEQYIRDNTDDKGSYAYALVPKETLYTYNARDSVTTTALVETLEGRLLAEPELWRTWNDTVLPAARAVSQVERWGMGADKGAMRSFDNLLAVRVDDLRQRLDGHFPGVNWRSWQQLGDILFGKLGLPIVKRSEKSGAPSTDEEVLEELRHMHEIPALVAELRSVEKLRSNYAGGVLPYVRADGRIHPSIHLDGARSGRTSVTEPPLQTIPSEKNDEAGGPMWGKLARDCYVAGPGNVLLSADYSQIELRVAAMLSGDPDMLAIFQSGVDYHQRTAELIAQVAWGLRPDQLEKRHRQMAKIINFSLLYGKGDSTLAKDLGCTMDEAKRIRLAILGQFRKLAAWLKKMIEECRRDGHVWTWWDGQRARRRPLWAIADHEDDRRVHAEHATGNTPVQGTASDFLIRSLVEAVDWLAADAVPAKLVLPVHDQLLFEVRRDALEEVAYRAVEIMTSHNSAGVPIVVDLDVGERWGSLEKYKLVA